MMRPNPRFDPAAYQKIVDYVDARLESDESTFDESLTRYQQVTERAAGEGVTVVAAAANDHQIATELESAGVNLQEGADYNFLGMSEHVITVAASDGDNAIADFSSHGTGADNPFGDFDPTVAIDGVGIDTGVEGVTDGTSFSSPQVAAIVHEMLEKDPTLTFEEIKQRLQDGATDTDADANTEGAGIITDPDAIIAGVPDNGGEEPADGEEDPADPAAVATHANLSPNASTAGGGVWNILQSLILDRPRPKEQAA